ncbi:MAG: ribosome biogenesis factor YjgA [Pseudomonadota bacterium]
MHGKDENGEYRGPSKSMRKREASAAQSLGTRLIALKESELKALALPETLEDAILLAKRITSRGGLARQRQYIGKLMRDLDPAPIEAALSAESRLSAQDAETHKRIEAWRARLLIEGPAALDELLEWIPGADRKNLQTLITKATNERVDSGSREGASRELFRTIRTLFEASS